MSYASLADLRYSNAWIRVSGRPASLAEAVAGHALHAVSRVAASLINGFGLCGHALRNRHSGAVLARLSDQSLRDIGVQRDQIFCLSSGAARQSAKVRMREDHA